MIKLYEKGVYLLNGSELVPEEEYAARTGAQPDPRKSAQGTIAYGILKAQVGS